MRKTRKRDDLQFVVAVIVTLVLIKAALYDGLKIRTYMVESSAAERCHTFVVLSDLHSTVYGKEQSALFREIDKLSPEAVFLVGDIGDDKRDFGGTALLLKKISDKYSCYYVTGNHERWVNYANDIKKLFESYGVITVSEKSISLGDGIVLHGIDDPLFYENDEVFFSSLSKLSVNDSSFDILLTHRPEFAKEYSDLGFDLVLSGHAHGGQVRIPFVANGIYASNQGFFPQLTGGEYTVGKCTLIISRGLMKNEIPRVFNPPEIVVINIK